MIFLLKKIIHRIQNRLTTKIMFYILKVNFKFHAIEDIKIVFSILISLFFSKLKLSK